MAKGTIPCSWVACFRAFRPQVDKEPRERETSSGEREAVCEGESVTERPAEVSVGKKWDTEGAA